uniref:Hemocyanin subunit C n=1 Tax=Scutigera coleoptrata TaxID=29022 RepID=HCYC_SCUCO|nr:RecName: Full=Hemocyanin subunit C; Flags: Precursor [Scutigera coleoptrata]CAD24086.1 hemocyanin subunit C [Scutigera coleoptrata]
MGAWKVWTFFAIALVVAVKAYDEEAKCMSHDEDSQVKERQILHIVDSINKPISPDFRAPRGVIDEHKLRGLGTLKKREIFSLFDERNWDEASKVVRLLLDAKDFDDFIDVAEVIRLRVNEELFLYAFSVAVMHRGDTQGLQVPRIHDIFPDKFLKEDVIHRLLELSNRGEHYDRIPIIDATQISHNYLDPNSELEYFLEDLGLNSHHHHWHVIHPAIWVSELGNEKDRKGEFFYWMHHQMLARYEAERMSNGLARTRTFQNWNDPIDEGYAPHISIMKTGYTYAYRPPGYTLRDLPNLPKNKMVEWAKRVLYSIHSGIFHFSNGTDAHLDTEHGIDELGNIVESSLTSLNRDYYGNLHCYAHVIAGRIADPEGKYGEDNGVMYDVATSARDPLFYRWHKYIDNIFQEYKNTLPPYTTEELTPQNSEFRVQGISVVGETSARDTVHTYWQHSLLKVGQGFEFTKHTPAYVKVKHLQHESFTYVIDVENRGRTRTGFFRIFAAPKYNELGQKWHINDQRLIMVEMDKFIEKLYPGKNTIERHSEDSTVTMSSASIFSDISSEQSEDHCSCGWPDYLLVPKGNFEGFPMEVFVIVTDYEEDKVEGPDEGCACHDALTYCGGIDYHFPDKRAMGFPFDRPIKQRNFNAFKTKNMGKVTVDVKFTGETIAPEDFHNQH